MTAPQDCCSTVQSRDQQGQTQHNSTAEILFLCATNTQLGCVLSISQEIKQLFRGHLLIMRSLLVTIRQAGKTVFALAYPHF